MNLIKKVWLIGLFLMSTLVVNYKANAAASTYGVSCSNTLMVLSLEIFIFN